MNTIKNEYKREALRLASMCLANNIPFEIAEYLEGFIVGYPSLKNRVSDAVCNNISYGRESGLLEIMGLVDEEKTGGDSVEGWLTAEEVFMRWNEHWLHHHNEGANRRPFSLAAPMTTGPARFYAICTNQHLFSSKLCYI